MAGLKIQVLSDEEVVQVHEASLRVLFEAGVDVCHDGMRDRLLLAPAQGRRALL